MSIQLLYDREITYCTGSSRKETVWNSQTEMESVFYARLEIPTRSSETLTEYLALTKDEQAELKDIGGFVGGRLNGPRRKAESVLNRCIVTLDFDNIPAFGTERVFEALDKLQCGYCVYSTRKHRPEAPRLRVVVVTDRDMTPDEYDAVSRIVAYQIGMEWADPTTFEVHRLMYWPSCCADGEYLFRYKDAPFLNVDKTLNLWTFVHGDWRNYSNLPQHPEGATKTHGEEQADPTLKTGPIGAFCRLYPFERVTEELIPGVYEPTATEGRYTYSDGTTTGGAVVYDNGLFLYSHHSTDPAGGILCNMFDLIRIHKFRQFDEAARPETPTVELPSYERALEFIKSLPDVQAELTAENAKEAIQAFSEAAQEQRKKDMNAPSVICLADLQERSPEWLIEGYIPKREITVMAGDGGVGKTFVWCGIAAAISSGNKPFLLNNAFPDNTDRESQRVMYFSSEDSNEAVLLPRLKANGAMLKNIITIDSAHEDFQKVKLNSVFLENLIDGYRPALVIFDPLQSFLPPRADMSARNQMREAMSKLHVFGEKYGATFLIIMHTNKMQKVWGRTRLADSADIWDISRSVLICGETGEKGLTTRYLSQEKSSYGKVMKTVLFRIEGNAANFIGYTDKRDREFVRAASKTGSDSPERDAAEQFILEYLGENGESPVKDLDSAAAANFFSPATLRRAKENLKDQQKITTRLKSAGKGKSGVWFVSLLHPLT